VYAGYYIGLPQQLASTYNYNSFKSVSAIFPIGMGPLIVEANHWSGSWTQNFRRHASGAGQLKSSRTAQQDIDGFSR